MPKLTGILMWYVIIVLLALLFNYLLERNE
jgi:hypothetical protein